MRPTDRKALQREILLGFWKAHVLHHAAEGPIVGHWMIRELRRHGYEVSPGTMYPLLERLEQHGWLRCQSNPNRGLKDRKGYLLTKNGKDVVAALKDQVKELYREVVLAEDEEKQ